MRRGVLLLGALGALLGGCAGGASSVDRKGGTITLAEPEEHPERFVLRRETVERTLERGPGWFLGRVRVEPVLREGGFQGYRILSLFPQQPDGKPRGIRPGDVVQRVNGHAIERPGQFYEVWKSLADADRLTVRLLRQGTPVVVTWAIRGSAPDGGASERNATSSRR